MKHLLCSILCLAAIHLACHAEVTKLPGEYRTALQDASRFHEISSATNLPPAIRSLCVDHEGRIADPKKKWQATDVILDSSLPTKRLIWAMSDGEYHVVHYERGGYVHSFHFLVTRMEKGKEQPAFVWRGIGGPQKDYKAFLQALKKNKLDDQRDYAH